MMALVFDAWVCKLDGACEKVGRVVAETLDEALAAARRLVTAPLGGTQVISLHAPGQQPAGARVRDGVLMRAGLAPHGMRAYRRFLVKPKQADQLVAVANDPLKLRRLAKKFGITEIHARRVVKGRMRWTRGGGR